MARAPDTAFSHTLLDRQSATRMWRQARQVSVCAKTNHSHLVVKHASFRKQEAPVCMRVASKWKSKPLNASRQA
eukprot:641990-Prymnesium_polylepis.1